MNPKDSTESFIDAILEDAGEAQQRKISHYDSSEKIARNVLKVDLDSAVSPAILSGLLGCNVSMLYQYRQDGKLPSNTDATYRECILHHVKYWKAKAVKKTSNIAEEDLIQKIKLNKAKTEREWLAVAKEKKEAIDGKVLLMAFEPYFVSMRGQLVAITRAYPETRDKIDSVLNTWKEIGEEMVKNANGVFETFIQDKLNEEIIPGEESSEESENE
jgi:hypothetical protein